MSSSASVLPISNCETSQRSKSNSGVRYLVVPGKCDMPPLAMIATRSFRPFTISAIALPRAAHRLGVGSGGTYVFVKKGTTGIGLLPITYSNGIENA